MSGVNKVIIVGNMGQDPETRYMPNGDAVTNITLATSESWSDKTTGKTVEKTEWHRITFFRKQAEAIAQYTKKGSKLYVEGRLQTRSWEQDGVKRYATDIIASKFEFLDSKQDNQAPAQQHQQRSSGSMQTQGNQPVQHNNQQSAQGDSFEDNIPF